MPTPASESSSSSDTNVAIAAWFQAVERGEQLNREEFLQRYSHLGAELRQFLDNYDVIRLQAQEDPPDAALTRTFLSPNDAESASRIDHVECQTPQYIGRYRIEKVLGNGGFGLVYLAHDDQLQRLVAIKVPHAKLTSEPEDAEAYLAEARMVANLDHPNIVPVLDVGSTKQFPCFVVSKYIDGTDLFARLRQSPLSTHDAVKLIATVAEALHHAHKQGLVHRDIKPGNILLDRSGKPYVGDFGLALREQDIGKGPGCVGTPAYMSPEQARGEGHRVDGRSDIFSLGVVFYELLVGRRPFAADFQQQLLEQIANVEARPPRQLDDNISKELDRICLKALSKRVSERYSVARDMVEDLNHYLLESTLTGKSANNGQQWCDPDAATFVTTSSTHRASDDQLVKIVPKGLRSFDAHDADFFLELLPGPLDRDNLPDSIRFWKRRIEEFNPDNTFSVGLIYGPSGCGKSSLVKAGLVPRLANSVTSVYVEATGNETEVRLLKGLRRQIPVLPTNLGLIESLAELRRGRFLDTGQKVLLVLDQFEQWLHSQRQEENATLSQALRQCDGSRVQCVIMVRDDFWLAVSRFMKTIEVEILEGRNSVLVDLFDAFHARKVLAAFGRAFGRLPDNLGHCSSEQEAFLDQAVSGLAVEGGKVISVRLALFAEMMKGKPWTPATLKAVGGTEGVGVSFLEETFGAASSPPEHRYHQKAARADLKVLMPERGSDIKGHMRSYAELMEASGYGNRPKDFEDLLRILDNDVRLITPTDPEGKETDGDSVLQTKPGQRYYQLTHDYLVHSIREWLTRKQKETRRGRAELRLSDLSATWNFRPENRFLPSWWENLSVRLLTCKKKWTEPQQKMMSEAGRVHGIRTSIIALLLIGMIFAGVRVRNGILEQRSQTQAQILEKENVTRAEGLVASLLSANISQVPGIVSDLKAYRKWADPLLQSKIIQTSDRSAEKLHVALALLPVDETQIAYLKEQLPVCTLGQFPVLRDGLESYKDMLTDGLWRIVEDTQDDPFQRFQAAAALAEFAPADERWTKVAPFVAQHLTKTGSSAYFDQWLQLFRGANKRLIDPLIAMHSDRNRTDKQRETAAIALSDYLRDRPDNLVDVVLVADEFAEFSPLVAALKTHSASVHERLYAEMQNAMPETLSKVNGQLSEGDQERRDAHWKRESLAAVTLVELGFADEVWSLLEFSPNPSLRSFIIHHLGKLTTKHNTLADRLAIESSVIIRQALIQILGSLDHSRVPPADRSRITKALVTLYVNDPDSGVHSSSLWTLKRWGVTLPEIPVGELTWTEEQKQRVITLTGEVESIRQRIVANEKELPFRQEVWERQLRDQSTASLPSLSDGLLVHYPFDELAGTEAANAIERKPGGSYAGPGQPKWVSGVSGKAVRLNGQGGHFDCGEAFNPERTDAFSCGCWFLAESEANRSVLFAKFDNAELKGFAINIDPTTNHIICELHHHWPDNALYATGKVAELVGRWHHLFVTYDGSSSVAGIKVYVDGQSISLLAELNNLSKSVTVSKPLQIGVRDGAGAFRGAIDDVRIYNRRLSDENIQDLFASVLMTLASEPSETRTPEQQELLNAAYRSQDEILRRIESQLNAAKFALRDARWNRVCNWYVNREGQTMLVIPYSSEYGDNPIDHSFAISGHEVTVAEFRRFRPQYSADVSITPADDCPATFVCWYDAAAYCNWLSEHAGISENQWIYEPNSKGMYDEDMKIKDDYLNLSGYRLPTDAEWNAACRAGTNGTYAFGEPLPLLERYGWCALSSSSHTHPVESLLPNANGLFDMYGNAWECIQNPAAGPMSPVMNQKSRGMRGGSFNCLSSLVGSAYGSPVEPSWRYLNIGFRVARTLPPVPVIALQITPEGGKTENPKTDW